MDSHLHENDGTKKNLIRRNTQAITPFAGYIGSAASRTFSSTYILSSVPSMSPMTSARFGSSSTPVIRFWTTRVHLCPMNTWTESLASMIVRLECACTWLRESTIRLCSGSRLFGINFVPSLNHLMAPFDSLYGLQYSMSANRNAGPINEFPDCSQISCSKHHAVLSRATDEVKWSEWNVLLAQSCELKGQYHN